MAFGVDLFLPGIEFSSNAHLVQMSSGCGSTDTMMHIYTIDKISLIEAALAHLGERQTEVHLSPALHMRFLEVLCSIHRSGIAFAFLPCFLA